MQARRAASRGRQRLAALLRSTLAVGAMAAGAAPSPGAAQGVSAPLAAFLEQTIGLTRDGLAAASRGEPVVKVLNPSDRLEVAAFGIVRVDVPRSFYVDRAADFPSSLRDRSRVRLGVFSNPASLADVASLSLPREDVDELAHCSPGSCKVKLSSTGISQLRDRLDANPQSADSIAAAFFRAHMVAYVTAYRAHGDSALIVYDDRRSSAAAANVFAGLLSRSPYMYQYAPSLERYLKHYPRDRPAGVREAIFWSEDDVPGLKLMLRITHEVVYSPPELPDVTFIVEKQIFADHYLDGALQLTAVVDQAGDPGAAPGVYLLVLRRLHFDDLPGGFLVNIRGRVISKLRKRTSTWLRRVKSSTEEAYASTRGASDR